jgi:GntR family transcriptional regulator
MSTRLPKISFASATVHQRLLELCRTAIERGDYAPGERFASEREMAARFDISRVTANKVISALVTEGLLELEKGLGSRVVDRPVLFASLAGMESFTAHARAQGMVPATEVLKFQRLKAERAPAGVRESLGVSGDSGPSLFYLERLRLADGVPVILEHRWVVRELAPGLTRDDVSESFYGVLENKFGLAMTGERHSISAVILSGQQLELFRLPAPAPALQVEGSGFVQGDRPLWYQRLFYRGDRYELRNETRGLKSSAVTLHLTTQA